MISANQAFPVELDSNAIDVVSGGVIDATDVKYTMIITLTNYSKNSCEEIVGYEDNRTQTSHL